MNGNYQMMGQGGTTAPKQNTHSKVVWGIVILILLLVVIGLLWFFLGKDKKEDSQPQPSESEEDYTEHYDENGPFLLAIEDVFNVTNQGTIVTGKIARGKVKVGDKMILLGMGKEPVEVEVLAIEKERKLIDSAGYLEEIGMRVSNVEVSDVVRGQVLVAPGSMEAHTNFEAKITLLQDEGKDITLKTNTSSSLYFRTTDVTGNITFSENRLEAKTGDTLTVTIQLEQSMALEVGTVFAIRDHGRTIGQGKVMKIIS